MRRLKPKADAGKQEESERLRARSRKPKSLVEFFKESPFAKVAIVLQRKPDYGREIHL